MNVLPAFDLRGRVALVTGGAGLLGPRHARALVRAGAHVVIADVAADRARAVAEGLAAEHGPGRVTFHALDVTDPAAVGEASAALNHARGHVDILVNNAAIDSKVGAGGLSEPSRLETFTTARWEKKLAVGLTGAFLCAQAFGTAMARRGTGVILNIASDLSVIAPDQRLYREEGQAEEHQPVKPVTYSVIKTGLVGLTRYLAAYWADKGVRVNALSPGGVQTDQPEVFLNRIAQLVPLGRMARADEYEAAVQFLCSDASSYMTGQNVVMDGGRSVI